MGQMTNDLQKVNVCIGEVAYTRNIQGRSRTRLRFPVFQNKPLVASDLPLFYRAKQTLFSFATRQYLVLYIYAVWNKKTLSPRDNFQCQRAAAPLKAFSLLGFYLLCVCIYEYTHIHFTEAAAMQLTCYGLS